MSESDHDRRMRLLEETRDAAVRQADAAEQLAKQQAEAAEEMGRQRDADEMRRRNEAVLGRLEREAAEARQRIAEHVPKFESESRRTYRNIATQLGLPDPFATLTSNGSISERDELAAWQEFANVTARLYDCARTVLGKTTAKQEWLESEARYLKDATAEARRVAAEHFQTNAAAQQVLAWVLAEVEPAGRRAQEVVESLHAREGALKRQRAEQLSAARAAEEAARAAKQQRRGQRKRLGIGVAISGALLAYFVSEWFAGVVVIGIGVAASGSSDDDDHVVHISSLE